jgi:hypothetical protein
LAVREFHLLQPSDGQISPLRYALNKLQVPARMRRSNENLVTVVETLSLVAEVIAHNLKVIHAHYVYRITRKMCMCSIFV